MCKNGKTAERCTHCNRRGQVKITGCPIAYVDQSIWDAASLVKFAEQGSWPLSGGTLDQTDSFLSFTSLWRSQCNRLESDAQE